jgi:hypothetical protein
MALISIIMKISIKQLKNIVRELKEDSTVPGKWVASDGNPLSDEDQNKLGTPNGMGSTMIDEIDDGQQNIKMYTNDQRLEKLQRLLDHDDVDQFTSLSYEWVKTGKFSKSEYKELISMFFSYTKDLSK